MQPRGGRGGNIKPKTRFLTYGKGTLPQKFFGFLCGVFWLKTLGGPKSFLCLLNGVNYFLGVSVEKCKKNIVQSLDNFRVYSRVKPKQF